MFRRGEDTNVIQQARVRKTRLFFEDRGEFFYQLVKDIQQGIRQAQRLGLTPVFRLNGTSDLSWEKYEVFAGRNIFEMFPGVQFYDYTKVLGRKVRHLDNYHLTFSAADGNALDVVRAMNEGMNVAVVFDHVPAVHMGRAVFDADETDLRFLDPPGVICGLKAKGRAKKDTTGFVRRVIPVAVA